MVGQEWRAHVPKMGAMGKSRRLLAKRIPMRFNIRGHSVSSQGSWSRGYDVALTWRRSRVQFSPSPPMIYWKQLLSKGLCFLPSERRLNNIHNSSDSGILVLLIFSFIGDSSSKEKSVEPPSHDTTSSLCSNSSSTIFWFGPMDTPKIHLYVIQNSSFYGRASRSTR